jgi:hypothetical protein
MWPLTSPRAKRISGLKIFRSPTEKDFFNTICHKQTHAPPCGLGLRPGGAARPFLAAVVIQELAGAGSTAGSVPEGLV